MNNTTFPTSFCSRVGKHNSLIARTEFCCNAIIQRMFLELPDCLSWRNRSYPTKDPKRRVSDGGQDPRELTPSTLYILNCATQWCFCKLNQNPQSNWNANRLIPKEYHGPLQKIFRNWRFRLWIGFFSAFCIFFAFYFSPLQLADPEWSGFPCRLIVVNITLHASYYISCPISRFYLRTIFYYEGSVPPLFHSSMCGGGSK